MSSLSSLSNSTVTNSLLTNTPTVSGLASGLDTNKLITGLLAVQQAQIDTLKANQSQVAARQTAFKG
ncbi:MAG TPA: flagellar cap protein FliD N-terminal domain-containing protein, partial [Gemmataceae bacterium]|nr:flagellar cap protein FliD N-terminal domain-containing protein [Gemmataceae bacterium]